MQTTVNNIKYNSGARDEKNWIVAEKACPAPRQKPTAMATGAPCSPGNPTYHLNDVMGPDEYKDRINDNAYTNYMARCTPQLCRSFPFGIRTWQNRGRLQPLLSVLRRGHGK